MTQTNTILCTTASPGNLTANSATRLMRDCGIRLANWSDFATDFGVPVDKRKEFRQLGLSTQESLEECVDYWIRNVPGNKSWRTLCSIVDKHENDTANKMRAKLGKHVLYGIFVESIMYM